jgi:autotransporter-associated beta strand protein
VLDNGVWSALLEAEFVPESVIPEYLRSDSADWTDAANWNTPFFPNGSGAPAQIAPAGEAERDINLRQPVTVGTIIFDLGAGNTRTRLRDRSTGNTLTFDGGAEAALVQVEGTGTGYVEIEVEAGTLLTSDLELRVSHLVGHPEHGALRLRAGWGGEGGLVKTGPGMASLTGEGKVNEGASHIVQGVLSVTEPAVLSLTPSVTVQPGGQLRLTSSGPVDMPRHYIFGGPLNMSGMGRSGVPADEGLGVNGALRYEPGGFDGHASVSNPVVVTGPSAIHVSGLGNFLTLHGALTGTGTLSKSGGGELILAGEGSTFDGAWTVSTGTLRVNTTLPATVDIGINGTLAGMGACGAVTGTGKVHLGRGMMDAASLNGTGVQALFTQAGMPSFEDRAVAGNGTLLTTTASPDSVHIYLDATVLTEGLVFRGALMLPPNSDWGNILPVVRVFAPDPVGVHVFDGRTWAERSDVGVTRVPVMANPGGGEASFEILEVRIGGSPVTFEAWQTRVFTDPHDLADPEISGAAAAPFGDGVPNLLRFAFGDTTGGDIDLLNPRVVMGAPPRFRFPYDPGRLGLRWRVESSESITDWSGASVLFDSSEGLAIPAADGWLEVPDPRDPRPALLYYRLYLSTE